MKLFLPALLAILALGACNKDKFGDGALDADKSASRKNNYVVYFDIRTNDDAVTRASYSDIEDAGSGDLVYGSEEEHAIGRGNFAFFFKENNQLIAISNIYLDSHRHNTDGDEQVKDENGNLKDNIEARYAAKMELDSENLPNSCLLLLNALHLEDKLKDITDKMSDENNPATFTLTDILALVDEVGKNENPFLIGRDGEGNKYFTMSNAVYVKDNKLQTAVPIPDGFIQQTPVPDPKKALTVYVERMVAKFTFEIQPKENGTYKTEFSGKMDESSPLTMFTGVADDGTLEYTAIDWRVELKWWSINALETKNFVFRNLEQSDKTDFPSGWSDPNNYRTYWSLDPHYAYEEIKQYPWQYRDMLDDRENNPHYPNFSNYETLHADAIDQNLLRNYSYSDFENFFPKDGSFAEKLDDIVVYTPENTYDYLAYSSNYKDFSKSLDGREHLLAGTHLIVGGVLKTDFSALCRNGNVGEKFKSKYGNENGFVAHDLYRDRSGFYYESEDECFRSLIHAFNMTLKSQKTMLFTYYSWNGEDKQNNGKRYVVRPSDLPYNIYFDDNQMTYHNFDDYSELDSQNGEREYTYHMIPATIKDGDGKRLPWPAGVKLSIKNTLAPYDELTTIYDEENKSTVYGLDLQNVIKSLLYEWVGAADHFHFGKLYYARPVSNPEGKSVFYGTVRNSWYHYVLTDVTGIGTPVDDPDQPIVPIDVEIKDLINIRMEVLDWHRIDRNVPIL